jgi:hypothetical protein
VRRNPPRQRRRSVVPIRKDVAPRVTLRGSFRDDCIAVGQIASDGTDGAPTRASWQWAREGQPPRPGPMTTPILGRGAITASTVRRARVRGSGPYGAERRAPLGTRSDSRQSAAATRAVDSRKRGLPVARERRARNSRIGSLRLLRPLSHRPADPCLRRRERRTLLAPVRDSRGRPRG